MIPVLLPAQIFPYKQKEDFSLKYCQFYNLHKHRYIPKKHEESHSHKKTTMSSDSKCKVVDELVLKCGLQKTEFKMWRTSLDIWLIIFSEVLPKKLLKIGL